MRSTLLLLAALSMTVPALALDYDQNVTPDVIFGSGNVNGFFTVDKQVTPVSTVELGLRGKVRFDASGLPQNIFNSDGAGVYSFLAGAAVGGWLPTTPVWNFEFTVNVDQTAGGGATLDDFTYELGLDFDPSPTGTAYLVFDPITPTVSVPAFDHALGDNIGTVVVATTPAEYVTYLATYYVAQNSWNYEFFNDAPFNTFDPAADGAYEIYLKAFLDGVEVAHTAITIAVGDVIANEDASWSDLKSMYR